MTGVSASQDQLVTSQLIVLLSDSERHLGVNNLGRARNCWIASLAR